MWKVEREILGLIPTSKRLERQSSMNIGHDDIERPAAKTDIRRLDAIVHRSGISFVIWRNGKRKMIPKDGKDATDREDNQLTFLTLNIPYLTYTYIYAVCIS